jgi:hypothetical protein
MTPKERAFADVNLFRTGKHVTYEPFWGDEQLEYLKNLQRYLELYCKDIQHQIAVYEALKIMEGRE